MSMTLKEIRDVLDNLVEMTAPKDAPEPIYDKEGVKAIQSLDAYIEAIDDIGNNTAVNTSPNELWPDPTEMTIELSEKMFDDSNKKMTKSEYNIYIKAFDDLVYFDGSTSGAINRYKNYIQNQMNKPRSLYETINSGAMFIEQEEE